MSQENINFTRNEETHVKNVKNYEKQEVLKIVKEKDKGTTKKKL